MSQNGNSVLSLSSLQISIRNLFPECSCNKILFLEKDYFSKQFQVYNKTEREVQRFLLHPLPLHIHSLPQYQSHLETGTLLFTKDERTLAYHNHPPLRFTLGVVHSVHLHICKMMYNPHYSIMQSIFTPLKNLYSAY